MKSFESLRRQRQKGVTLIEVLVAAMVLAVGLLGLAALLGSAMQSNQHANARTQAIFLASDMMDRVRANRVNSEDYYPTDLSPDQCDRNWSPDDDLTVAENDLAEWTEQLACYLPEGRGRIIGTADADGNTVLQIIVTWTAIDEDVDDGEDQETESITLWSEI